MALAKRIIPCLDVDNGRVVKGVKFENIRDAGDPVEQARIYDREGADELTFLDITASHENRDTIYDVVRRTAEQVFMPLTVGGGARWQSVGWQDIYNSPKGGYEEFSQESYWLVDLMTRYQFTKNVSATLNVNNIFDKTYYTNIGFYNSAAYGEPRNFMLSTRWDF